MSESLVHILTKLNVLIHSVVSDSLWPMDCNPPGSSVHGILQARLLECIVISFSGDLPDPGIELVTLTSSKSGRVMMSHLLWSSQKSQDSWGNACSSNILSSGCCCQSTSPQCPQHCRETPPAPRNHEADTLEGRAYLESLNGWLWCFPRWAERCVNT